jgi:Zn-dependent protease
MLLILPLAVDFQNPLLWAALIGWILTVVLHEFAHGIVAHWGGDFTIRERGGLTLNPLQYVDPMFSLLIPAVILLIGGIPLPGGVTYIRRDLLRSRFWDVAVSLAGPAMNLLLFIVCVIPLHPALGWVDTANPTTAQLFLGTMALLQLTAFVLNLMPVPPLDGFQALAPFLPGRWLDRLTPQISWFFFFVYFMMAWRIIIHVFRALEEVLLRFGYENNAYFLIHAWRETFLG